MEQSLITIVVPLTDVSSSRLEEFEKALRPYGNLHRYPPLKDEDAYKQAQKDLKDKNRDDLRASILSWCLKATNVIHFMSLNVVPPSQTSPAHLLIDISADGPSNNVLGLLTVILDKEIPSLREILGIAEGRAALKRILAEHMLDVGPGWTAHLGLPFNGTPGMTVTRITAEADLACSIFADLQQNPMREAMSPLQILEAVRRKLWREGEKWAFFPEPISGQNFKPAGRLKLYLTAGLGTVLGLIWPYLVAALALSILAQLAFGSASGLLWGLGVWTFGVLIVLVLPVLAAVAFFQLNRSDELDDPPLDPPEHEKLGEIMQQENHCASNHLFAVSTLKSGWYRQITLRLVFLAIAQLARFKFGPGILGDLKTINFACWVLIPKTNRLVFLSNYSGSWESYLEDFITKAHAGLTGVWSNTRNFPKSRNLFQEGATDGDRFKRWARAQQEPTRLWFCAYPGLTTGRIRLNSLIRQGIALATTEREAADWLSCFGSAPRPPSAIEVSNVPSLVFGGLSPFRYGAALILSLRKETAKEWLATVKDNVVYGDVLPKTDQDALVVAFTASGLERLGLDGQALETFPAAFRDGMNAEWRSRNLGDVDKNAPGQWAWGHEPGTDAIMLLYAREANVFDEALRKRRAALRTLGHEVQGTVMFTELPEKAAPDQRVRAGDTATRPPAPSGQKEAFGFVDGVSQPVIRGTRRWTARRDEKHLVQPGEIVLGYPDNRGKVPPSPWVLSALDPCNLLPPVEGHNDGHRPNFSRPQPTGERDLGRDGTFLVVRQLEQDTDQFKNFIDVTAEKLEGDARVPADPENRREWIMAKLVGRWPDGTSLVRYPNEPGTKRHPHTQPDNDFLFAQDDPDGLRCPLGSHIRRANPRDSLGSGDSAVQITISNRHRIFRVGRRYPAQDGFGREGLLFMCLNADIERQFEFVQQTWTTSTSFHGLENEVDCFSPAGGTKRFTVPTAHGPLCFPRMTDFVRMRGGGYFFLPGRRALLFLASRQDGATAERAQVAQAV
jgi:deferrochelatase/peroxidase EfeB